MHSIHPSSRLVGVSSCLAPSPGDETASDIHSTPRFHQHSRQSPSDTDSHCHHRPVYQTATHQPTTLGNDDVIRSAIGIGYSLSIHTDGWIMGEREGEGVRIGQTGPDQTRVSHQIVQNIGRPYVIQSNYPICRIGETKQQNPWMRGRAI